MIPNKPALCNSKESPSTGNLPDLAALRAIWRTLASEEASSPPGRRLGIARRRQELLSVFPAWMLPDVLDELNRPDPMEVLT